MTTGRPVETTDEAGAVLELRPSRSAVLPGSRVSVAWATRNAHSLRIAGPDGFGTDVDASVGHGHVEVVVHRTGEISAVAYGYDGCTVVATTPVAVVEPQRVIEFPEIDLANVFVPSYQRLAIPLLERTRQSGALLGAARPDTVQAEVDRSVHRRSTADRFTALTPPPSLFTVVPTRSTWRSHDVAPGPALSRTRRAGAIVTLFSTFVGKPLRRKRRPRGSGKP